MFLFARSLAIAISRALSRGDVRRHHPRGVDGSRERTTDGSRAHRSSQTVEFTGLKSVKSMAGGAQSQGFRQAVAPRAASKVRRHACREPRQRQRQRLRRVILGAIDRSMITSRVASDRATDRAL